MTDETNEPGGLDDEESTARPWHPSKYPGTDRAAVLPGAGRFPSQTIDEALEEVDRTSLTARAAAGEQERLQVVARFPIAGWPTMTLERYALGTAQAADSFCRWMEFNTPNLASIRGGSALKHMIFKRQGVDAGWYFERKYSSVEEAWEHVRAGFVEAFRLAAEGRLEEIGQIDAISAAVSLTTKTIYCYFPDDVLPVCSGNHQDHFWRLLGGVGPITHGVPAAKRLLDLAHQNTGFDGWHPSEIMGFLYQWADPRQGQRMVKIAPGPDAKLWDDCTANGYIRVGWDEVGDLRRYDSREQFEAKFADAYLALYNGNAAKTTEKAREVWTLTELAPGDIVIANKGTSRVVGIGRVVEPGYERRDDLGDFGHTVAVDWNPGEARDIDPIRRWAFKTVAPVSQAEYSRILKGRTDPTSPKPPGKPVIDVVDPLLQEIAAELRRKGQVILYGPPGTGKTYNARRFAVWWLSDSLHESEPARLLGDYSAFRVAEEELSHASSDGRVWWVTANAKEWSWDQLEIGAFVEYRYGRLQKNYPLLSQGDLVVGYQSNPTKRIVALGRIAETLHHTPRGEKISIEGLHHVRNGPTWDELLSDERMAGSEPVRNRSQGTLFSLTPSEATYLVSWLKERDPEFPELLDEESDLWVGHLTRVTFHPSYTYEDFVEGFKPVPGGTGSLQLALEDGVFKRVCAAARLKPDEPFLLLIDEINRGNIPKIFGELITLLERDKRGLSVTLPLSREKFEVPPNVYLLGTMNTADRSIRLLDAALRRRFAFIELMPDVSLLEGAVVGGLDLGRFLSLLNDRIAKTEGREKQIGHSYLLDDAGEPLGDIETFAAQFRHEIVPLLQEYAFEDYRELESYLGKGVVDLDGQRIRPSVLEDSQSLMDALTSDFQQAITHSDQPNES